MSNKTNNFLIQGVAYTVIDSDARAAIQTLAEGLDAKNAIFQYSTMPTAASTNVGQIVQFVGTSTSDYTNGYFYKCIADSGAGTYVWEAIPTQEAANIFQVSTTAELEAIEDGQIVQFVGTTTASYTNGHFYTATTVSDVKTISEVQVQTHAQTPRLLATVTTLADLKTQLATAITGFKENHMASLTVTADITLDNNYVLVSGTNVLFWYDNSAAQVMGVAISSEGVASIRTSVGGGIIVYTINGYKSSGSSGEAPEVLSAVSTLAELKENLSEVITRHGNGESTFVTFSVYAAITLDNGVSIPSLSAISAYFSNGVPSGVVAYSFTQMGSVKTLQIGASSGTVNTVNGNQLYDDSTYSDRTSVINIDTLAELKESLAEIYDSSLGDAPKQYSVNTAFAFSNSITIPVNSNLFIFGHKYDDDGYTGLAVTPSGVMYTIVTDYPDATDMVVNLYKVTGAVESMIGDLANLQTTTKTDIVSAINEIVNPTHWYDELGIGTTTITVTFPTQASSAGTAPLYVPKDNYYFNSALCPFSASGVNKLVISKSAFSVSMSGAYAAITSGNGGILFAATMSKSLFLSSGGTEAQWNLFYANNGKIKLSTNNDTVHGWTIFNGSIGRVTQSEEMITIRIDACNLTTVTAGGGGGGVSIFFTYTD